MLYLHYLSRKGQSNLPTDFIIIYFDIASVPNQQQNMISILSKGS